MRSQLNGQAGAAGPAGGGTEGGVRERRRCQGENVTTFVQS